MGIETLSSGLVHEQNPFLSQASHFQKHTVKPGKLRNVTPGEEGGIMIGDTILPPRPPGVACCCSENPGGRGLSENIAPTSSNQVSVMQAISASSCRIKSWMVVVSQGYPTFYIWGQLRENQYILYLPLKVAAVPHLYN